MKNFIFDLDMTLLDSSELYHYRQWGNWKEVMDNLDKVVAFVTDDGEVHTFVKKLKEEGKTIGIVTSSPKHYAEELLKLFDIPYDCLVSGSEITNFKPHPEGILKCMDTLNADKTETVYIGDDKNDFIAAHRAEILSIGCSWGHAYGFNKDMFSHSPDILIKSPRHFLRDLSFLKYVGERYTAREEIFQHKGSFVKYSEGTVKFRCLGRYFSSAHSRRNMSLSEAINKFKTDDSDRVIFINSILKWLKPDSKWKPDIIISVPPKPGQTDRFATLRSELAQKLNCEDGLSKYVKCTKVITDYKTKNFNERKTINKDLYDVVASINEKKILLVDDVITSGSTIMGIAKKLYDNGASDVRCVGFGLNQFDVFDDKVCPKCAGKLKLINGRRGTFWGCENYWPSKACDYSRSCD